MCTVNDDDDGEISGMEEKEKNSLTAEAICRKCREKETEVVLRGKDPYCRTCFLVYATHKFRASLGKSKLIHRGDKVLVGFSGSANSLTLLHLIKAGIEEETRKRLVFEPCFIYIDEGAALNTDYENRLNALKEIKHRLKQFNVVSYIAILESIFNLNEDKVYYDLDSEIPIASDSPLSQLFSKIKSLSSKEELLVKLRNNFLLKIANDLGCCKILTGESLFITASKILSNISLGRGAQLPFDIGFCDSRDKDIKILRPMQDFGKEEIDFYCKVFNLQPIKFSSFETNENSSNSIQMLTRKFVDGLQENFPSTISTVYRISAKLTIENEAEEAMEKCPLCKGPLDTNVNESSSLQATVYSSIISKNDLPGNCMKGGNEQIENGSAVSCNEKVRDCKCSGSAQGSSLSKGEVTESLCYGCRLIVSDVESIDLLPKEIVDSISENFTLRQMKNEIQEFLL